MLDGGSGGQHRAWLVGSVQSGKFKLWIPPGGGGGGSY